LTCLAPVKAIAFIELRQSHSAIGVLILHIYRSFPCSGFLELSNE